MYAANSRIHSMSNDLPPFVSNSPPPLCHSDSVESDDDFGDFSNAYETYDSPKKKAPDLYNGVLDQNTPKELLSRSSIPSQSVLCDNVTKMNNEIANLPIYREQTHSTFDVTDNSLLENISSNSLPCKLEEISNSVITCTFSEKIETTEESVLRLSNDINSNVENCSRSLTEESNLNVHIIQPCKHSDIIDTIVPDVPLSAVSNGVITCDTHNSIINLVDETENNFSTVDDGRAYSRDLSNERTVDHPGNETQEKRKRGISSEIKKFLEHEKDIENKFNHYECKFRSPSAVDNAEPSPDTPPTSPEFEPKLSKSFEDGLDDEYGSFENFNKFQSNEHSEDFGDFKFSEVNNQSTVNVDSQDCVMKTEALNLGEDVISTKDIKLEFSEQSICDNSEIITTQNPRCSESAKPPLDIDDICFEDKENTFEPDFGQFEATAIAELETSCKNTNETVPESEVISNSKPVQSESTIEHLTGDDGFGDFSNSLEQVNVSISTSILPAHIQQVSNKNKDDDFGAFSGTEEEITASKSLSKNSIQPDLNEEEAEFGDFNNAIGESIGKTMSTGFLLFSNKNDYDKDFEDEEFSDATEDVPFEKPLSTDAVKVISNENNLDDFGDFNNPLDEVSSIESKPASIEPIQLVSNEDDEFGDFNNSLDEVSSMESKPASIEPLVSNEDDDFGEFNNPLDKVSSIESKPASIEPIQLVSNEDDEFGDFKSESVESQVEEFGNFSQQNFATPVPSSNGPSRMKFDVSSMSMADLFENPAQELPECPVSTLDLSLSQDKTWSRLHDIENTSALSYQWNNSASNKTLLSALHIDTRNIIFGPRWKENVPRFAANLGYSPLEPSKPGDTLSGEAGSSQADHIPDPHFDWNSSGLTNPLDGQAKSSRQTLEEELTGPALLSPPKAPTNAHSLSSTPARTSELIINVDKFIDSLPNIGFMLTRHVVYPGNQH